MNQEAWHETEKEKVSGARRVWRTTKSTTPGAISSALKETYTTIGNQVSIKYKHKQLASGHNRWWFVLKGEEQVPTQLDDEWNVCVWKLELCFKPKSLKMDTYTDSTIDLAVPVPGPIVSTPAVSTCLNEFIVSAATDVQTAVNSSTAAHNSSTQSMTSGFDASDNQ